MATHLYSLWIKAVWTTFGCCAAAAAPTGGARLPLDMGVGVGETLSRSLSVPALWLGSVPFRSAAELFRVGGPMEGAPDGVMSMASRGGASDEPDEGRMGMDLWRLGWCGSGEKGLRRASATEAMARGCGDGEGRGGRQRGWGLHRPKERRVWGEGGRALVFLGRKLPALYARRRGEFLQMSEGRDVGCRVPIYGRTAF